MPSPALPGWGRFLAWAGVALLFTAFHIQHSLHHGRLAFPPTYDDVGYFEDAQWSCSSRLTLPTSTRTP